MDFVSDNPWFKAYESIKLSNKYVTKAQREMAS